MGVRAIVGSGRPLVDEAADLAEGTEPGLVVDDEGDDLSEPERGTLHRAIPRSLEQAATGTSAPAEVIRELLRAVDEGQRDFEEGRIVDETEALDRLRAAARGRDR